MVQQEDIEQLIDFITYALETATELHHILGDFQQTVVPLEALNLRQESLTNELNKQQQAITQWFGQHNLAPNDDALKRLSAELPVEEATILKRVWYEWQKLVRQCHQQLLMNARTTTLSRQELSRSLAIFKGQAVLTKLV